MTAPTPTVPAPAAPAAPTAPPASPAPAPAPTPTPTPAAPSTSPVTPSTNLGLTKAEDMADISDADLTSILGIADDSKAPAATAPTEDLLGLDEPDAVLEPLAGTPARPGPLKSTPEAPAPEPEPEKPLIPQPTPEPATPAAAAPAEPAAPETPTTPAAAKSTEYTVRGPDGKFAALPEGIVFDYKANGKQREGRTVEQVIRAAQWGEHNAEREQSIVTGRAEIAQKEQAIQDKEQHFQQTVGQYEQWFNRVLTDPDFYQRAVQAHAQQHSPEARAERAEARLAEVEARRSQESEALFQRHFVATELTPRWDRLEAENKLVTKAEIAGQFALLTTPLLVRGVLPTARLADVARLVDTELSTWAQQLHASRETEKRRTDTRVEDAQTREALAKRQSARASATPSTAPPSSKPKGFKTADEWLDRILPVRQESE